MTYKRLSNYLLIKFSDVGRSAYSGNPDTGSVLGFIPFRIQEATLNADPCESKFGSRPATKEK